MQINSVHKTFMDRSFYVYRVQFLNRWDAVGILQEIMGACRDIFPFMAIMPPNANNMMSRGYQIHIRTNSSSLDKSCIERITQENNLALDEEKGVFVIYKPIKEACR